jgi:iron complex transport system ATP-binding protein
MATTDDPAARTTTDDPANGATPPPLVLSGVTVHGDPPLPGAPAPMLLAGVDWTVRRGEHWAVLGRNGAGKTTLLRTIAGALIPTEGSVRALGEPLGAPGLRDPRLRISMLGGARPTFAGRLTGLEVVRLREGGPIGMLGSRTDQADPGRARDLLERFGGDGLAQRRFAECSQGERQRILLARALLRRPALVLLDEPTTGLDLPGREDLLGALERLAREEPDVATVAVTHHVEELPASTTHALLLRGGRILDAGPVDETLTADALSACFGLELVLTRDGGRWAARAR